MSNLELTSSLADMLIPLSGTNVPKRGFYGVMDEHLFDHLNVFQVALGCYQAIECDGDDLFIGIRCFCSFSKLGGILNFPDEDFKKDGGIVLGTHHLIVVVKLC